MQTNFVLFEWLSIQYAVAKEASPLLSFDLWFDNLFTTAQLSVHSFSAFRYTCITSSSLLTDGTKNKKRNMKRNQPVVNSLKQFPVNFEHFNQGTSSFG